MNLFTKSGKFYRTKGTKKSTCTFSKYVHGIVLNAHFSFLLLDCSGYLVCLQVKIVH